MYRVVIRVLSEGAISPAEIEAREKAEAARQAKILREKELCALGPWLRYLEENPGMKVWAEANPGPAEAKKKIMTECGIHVVDSPAEIGKKVAQILN